MWHQVQNNTRLVNHSDSVRRLKEPSKKSTKFDQSKLLIEDLIAQRGGVRNVPQKMNNTLV